MLKKIVILFFVTMLVFSCSKKEEINPIPESADNSFKVYQEAYDSMTSGEFFYAAKKFGEAELILPTIELSAKASIMSSYCLYKIRFYDQAVTNLEIFLKKYPASEFVEYANYLIIISFYEQILDEKKDRKPLLLAKSKIENYLDKFQDNDYTLDLKFKLDLINNQLAAKEMFIAKYYIKTKKWIPAINRLKIIVKDYDTTVFVEEALLRLVEVYYTIGLNNEAQKFASILGFNYNSSEWFELSYKILNKDYEKEILKKSNENLDSGILSRTIEKIFNKK